MEPGRADVLFPYQISFIDASQATSGHHGMAVDFDLYVVSQIIDPDFSLEINPPTAIVTVIGDSMARL